MIRTYELTYLVSADFSDEELRAFCDKIGGFISGQAGIIENLLNPIKRKLAYPIKKRNEAFLTSIIFKIDSENLEKIEKNIKAENDILRYIIIAKKPQKLVKGREGPRVYEKIQRPKKKVTLERKYEPEKIELKEIDKKIEEILNQ